MGTIRRKAHDVLDGIIDLVQDIRMHREHTGSAVRFRVNVGPVLPKSKGAGPMLEITLDNEQKVKVTLSPVTKGGKAAELDEPPTWSVAAGTCTVADVAPDGLSGFIVTGDDPGDSEIVIAGDADLGDGVVTVSEAITVHVNGALAGNLGVTLGQPEPK